jgi:multidrug efflux system outer membrane protein
VEAEARRYHLSELRYRGGVDSSLTLLTAQRDLFAARQQLIQTRLARLTNLVDLYKALGGGWKERTTTAPGG